MRAVIEEGLRRMLAADAAPPPYRLPDPSIGRVGKPNPMEAFTWQDLRDEIDGGR